MPKERNSDEIELSKEQFEALLRKAAQPLKQPDSKETETSESHPSGGYSGKRKNRDKTEGGGG